MSGGPLLEMGSADDDVVHASMVADKHERAMRLGVKGGGIGMSMSREPRQK